MITNKEETENEHKVINSSINQWALSVLKRLEKESPELLKEILKENKEVQKV